jgi:hypothetical protein
MRLLMMTNKTEEMTKMAHCGNPADKVMANKGKGMSKARRRNACALPARSDHKPMKRADIKVLMPPNK